MSEPTPTPALDDDEKILYGATRMALARGLTDLAVVLLDCRAEPYQAGEHEMGLVLWTPVEAYDFVQGFHAVSSEWQTSTLMGLFQDANPNSLVLEALYIKPLLDAATPDWREQLRSQIEGEASNQGRPFGDSRIIVHNGLNYRSKSERAIAMALERAGDPVLFFPNAAAVVGKVPREPDFLIFYHGKVGILEVDGPHHAGRAADDSLRDSFFERHHLWVKHYPSETCLAEPEAVVKDFLGLLLKS